MNHHDLTDDDDTIMIFQQFPQSPQPLTAREADRIHLTQLREATRLVTDACYLLSAEVGVEINEAERKEWSDRWLEQAGAYLTSIGGAP